MNLAITLVYNLAMIVIYRIKHPLFEQFRVNQVFICAMIDSLDVVVGLSSLEEIA